MIKLLDFDPVDKYGEPTVRIIPKKEAGVKLASSEAFAPEIQEFIRTLKPVVGKLYALINAMGATEYFSCNRNGDAFYEDALKKYHHTFVEDGHAFMHHKNKDPNKSYGKVVFSAYNDKMHRVELVVEYDTSKLDKKFVDKINNGEMVNVSMGCRVDSDYCSICGHRAKTPKDYCKHLKSEPGLTRMLPDGRKAFAINKDPHFFDISIVTIPADPTARIMAKLASDKTEVVSSVERAADEFRLDTMSKTAEATIHRKDLSKEIEESEDLSRKINSMSKPDSLIGKMMDMLTRSFDEGLGVGIPRDILNCIGSCSDNPIPILSGFIKKRIFLRPHEVQRIVLVSSGKEDLADKLEDSKIVALSDPSVGLKAFRDDDEVSFEGTEMLPQLFEDSRTINDPVIKRITIKILAGDEEEKTAGIRALPTEFSDDFKYLMDPEGFSRTDNSGLGAFLKSSTSAVAVLGSVVAAFGALLGGGLTSDFVKGVGLGSIIGGPGLINSISNALGNTINKIPSLDKANKPVQEMQFMNPNRPEVIEAALADAVAKASSVGGLKLGSFNKRAFTEASLSSMMPKALLSIPLAYGASKLINNEAKKDAMEEAKFTGKYEPSWLSKSSVTLPLSLAMIMKFASAEDRARSYIKSAEAHGLTKNNIYSNLDKILFEK